MAHELEMVAGKAQMAYVGDVPWHGLGTKVDPNLSPKEFQIVAGLDWRVEEVDSFVEFNGRKIPTGQKALVRDVDGRVLTQVGKNWHPVQNDEAFDFFAEFVEAGDLEMHTAGSLKNGEIIWALAKATSSFTLFGGDTVEQYFLFSNPHQYGKSIDIRTTPTRVVCNNTLTMALSGAARNGVKVSHRKAFDAEEVKQLLGLADMKLDRYKEAAEYLGSKRLTDAVVKQYFGELLGTSNKVEGELSRNGNRAMELLDTQPGAEYASGTLWSAVNAVTYLTNHEMGRSADTRMQSTWFGANQKLNIKAMNLALEMADAA